MSENPFLKNAMELLGPPPAQQESLRRPTIERDIPIPEIARPATYESKYPFREMAPPHGTTAASGATIDWHYDSFLFPPSVTAGQAKAAAGMAAPRLGMKFTLRTTPEGIRCWRVA